MSIHMSVETVTPDLAKAWLTSRAKNRTLNQSNVKYLAREIVQGNWKLTHQGIAFDTQGALVDGQHRLAAIVAANQPVKMVVTRGLSQEDCIAAVDQGKIRNRGQLFAMRGERYATHKAAMCRVINLLLTPDLGYAQSLGPSQDVSVLELYREPIEAVLDHCNGLSARFLGVAAVLMATDQEAGKDFLVGVATGANLQEGDPRLSLRNWLLGTSGKMSSTLDAAEVILRTAAAIAAFMDGEQLKIIRSSASKYARFCTLMKLPLNVSLYSCAGGTLRPRAKAE